MDLEVKTRVIKRNGEEVDFRLEKIVNAIKKANEEVENIHRMNDFQIIAIAEKIAQQAEEFTHAVNVEDIQDMVETGIMEMRGYEVAQKYVRYRYKRELTRKSNTTDNGILALIDHMNEEVKQENSNKNPVINSTQRDYMAGEVSKDLTKRVLLPEEIVRAHEEGIIHFHDMDYFAQKEHNCDLINLEDMLQNGTVISETMIEKPHSFFTACNVTTQIVAQVASNQYGGQSFTLSHLAPFVDVSRQKLRKSVIEERIESGEVLDDAIIDKITERRLRTEVQSGIQTIQYQLITLMTCNGQAPFVTVFMYLDEVPEGRTRDDLAMIIEEVMKQRMQGVKNEKGVWITPAFPKLIYVLDEDNITEDSKYWYLTELAAKCTAKRMVPDYISAKIMKELKNGDVYPCMGCRSFLTVEDSQRNADGSHKFYGRFNQGVVTINLVDVACSAEGNMERFWEILDERLELCHRALRSRRSPFIRLVLHAEINGQGILHTYNLITLFSRAPLRRLVQHADRLFRKRTVGGLEHLNIGQTAVLLDHERKHHTALNTVLKGDLRELDVLLNPVAEGIEVAALKRGHGLGDQERLVVLDSLLDNLHLLNHLGILVELGEVHFGRDLRVVGHHLQQVGDHLHLDLLRRFGRLLVLTGNLGNLLFDRTVVQVDFLDTVFLRRVGKSGDNQRESHYKADFKQKTPLVLKVCFG